MNRVSPDITSQEYQTRFLNLYLVKLNGKDQKTAIPRSILRRLAFFI